MNVILLRRPVWLSFRNNGCRISMLLFQVHPISDVPVFNATSNAGSYIEDDTPPQLVSFSLDLNTDIVRLTFDETISYLTVNRF